MNDGPWKGTARVLTWRSRIQRHVTCSAYWPLQAHASEASLKGGMSPVTACNLSHPSWGRTLLPVPRALWTEAPGTQELRGSVPGGLAQPCGLGHLFQGSQRRQWGNSRWSRG